MRSRRIQARTRHSSASISLRFRSHKYMGLPPFSAPTATFVSASLESRTPTSTQPHIAQRHDAISYPAATHIVAIQLQVSSQRLHEGEKYAIVQAIGYYDPAGMRLRARAHKPAPPSLLFLPTDVQPAPEPLRQHLKRIHCVPAMVMRTRVTQA
ncbi:hypothetical protein B0H13DRAFT_2047741 [Mycena leptocephala]|nr:hypothetical protein B0H13DRAFT_2047741 [Mycena leptocephala]